MPLDSDEFGLSDFESESSAPSGEHAGIAPASRVSALELFPREEDEGAHDPSAHTAWSQLYEQGHGADVEHLALTPLLFEDPTSRDASDTGTQVSPGGDSRFISADERDRRAADPASAVPMHGEAAPVAPREPVDEEPPLRLQLFVPGSIDALPASYEAVAPVEIGASPSDDAAPETLTLRFDFGDAEEQVTEPSVREPSIVARTEEPPLAEEPIARTEEPVFVPPGPSIAGDELYERPEESAVASGEPTPSIEDGAAWIEEPVARVEPPVSRIQEQPAASADAPSHSGTEPAVPADGAIPRAEDPIAASAAAVAVPSAGGSPALPLAEKPLKRSATEQVRGRSRVRRPATRVAPPRRLSIGRATAVAALGLLAGVWLSLRVPGVLSDAPGEDLTLASAPPAVARSSDSADSADSAAAAAEKPAPPAQEPVPLIVEETPAPPASPNVTTPSSNEQRASGTRTPPSSTTREAATRPARAEAETARASSEPARASAGPPSSSRSNESVPRPPLSQTQASSPAASVAPESAPSSVNARSDVAPAATPPPAASLPEEKAPPSVTASSATANPPPASSAAPTSAPPPPPAAGAPTSAVPAASATAADIHNVLTRYANAYSDLDAAAVRDVWPSVDARALTRAFRSLEEQEIAFDSCDIDANGTRATASCGGTMRYVPRIGNRDPRTERRRWQFTMRRVGDRWLIDTVQSR